jgi:hypothetical protein
MISRVPQAKVIKPRRRYLRRTLDHLDAATKIKCWWQWLPE